MNQSTSADVCLGIIRAVGRIALFIFSFAFAPLGPLVIRAS
jgi:hypothetical protein